MYNWKINNNMKTKLFALSNFAQGNTPKLIEKIGNLSLILSLIGVTIAGLPATMEASGIQFVLPPILATISHVAIAVGVILKTVSKLFGTIEETK